jgi:hypothetical protein
MHKLLTDDNLNHSVQRFRQGFFGGITRNNGVSDYIRSRLPGKVYVLILLPLVIEPTFCGGAKLNANYANSGFNLRDAFGVNDGQNFLLVSNGVEPLFNNASKSDAAMAEFNFLIELSRMPSRSRVSLFVKSRTTSPTMMVPAMT